MTVATVIDLVVAGLLLATIFYAVMLNRKLGQLRTSRAEFERLVTEFSAAAVRTEGSIAALKDNAETRQADLQTKVDRASALRDELAFMLERGDGLAAQLDSLIRSSRRRNAPAEGSDGGAADVRGLRGFG